MDQMACAVGSFVYIDFEKTDEPKVLPIEFSLSDAGYSLCIVNTGGSHSDLNEDYASVPCEMKAVARELGGEVLRGVDEAELITKTPELREKLGDRAVLRALHFIRENKRVEEAKTALLDSRLDSFFKAVNESGSSSFKYLQNVYTTKNVSEQGLSLALCLTENYLRDKKGAFRVHGGGFAGTIQAYVRSEDVEGYRALMDGVFGNGACLVLRVRMRGAIRVI
jgi:galactokinase